MLDLSNGRIPNLTRHKEMNSDNLCESISLDSEGARLETCNQLEPIVSRAFFFSMQYYTKACCILI